MVDKTSMQLLDGKKTADTIRKELAEAVKLRKKEGKKIPLCFVNPKIIVKSKNFKLLNH